MPDNSFTYNYPTCAAGGQVPHFTVRSWQGTPVAYARLWQRQHLLLVALGDARGDDADADAYVAALEARMADLTANETACVITRDPIPGLAAPGVLVADRWGEIQYVTAGKAIADLPGPDALVEWLRYVQVQCPECQGETR